MRRTVRERLRVPLLIATGIGCAGVTLVAVVIVVWTVLRTPVEVEVQEPGSYTPGSSRVLAEPERVDDFTPDPALGLTLFPSPEASASSEYPSSRVFSYSAENAIDGNTETWWGEGVVGDGLGEYLQVSWSGTMEVHLVRVVPGYMKMVNDKYGDRWSMNNRIKRAEILFSDGQSIYKGFREARDWHIVEIDPPVEASWLRVVIKDVYPGYSNTGKRVMDSGISEIEVWGTLVEDSEGLGNGSWEGG